MARVRVLKHPLLSTAVAAFDRYIEVQHILACSKL
jgi:hypothetical protein